MISVADPGCLSRIPNPGSWGPKAPDPGSGSATLVLIFLYLDQSVPLSGGKVERTIVVVRHQLYVVLESHVVGNLTDDYIMSSFILKKYRNSGAGSTQETKGGNIYRRYPRRTNPSFFSKHIHIDLTTTFECRLYLNQKGGLTCSRRSTQKPSYL